MSRDRFRISCVAIVLALCALPVVAAPIEIEVDAREAPRRLFHARLVIPVTPGPLRLLYPKWIPGEHGPSGPIVDLAGIEMSARGKPVPWRRDPVDMYAFSVEVPQGADKLEVSVDYLSPTATEGFTSAACANETTAVLNWNQVLLYPDRPIPGELRYKARLTLPSGWTSATSLAREGETAFAEVSLRTLIDSPVAMGVHGRVFRLASEIAPPHEIDVFADSDVALRMPDELHEKLDHLVEEARALFGATHYRSYRFLLTLSDNLAHFGLEHHESSDNRSYERALVDSDRRRLMSGLLPHEFVHSWNGKYRRPADLTLDDFHQPANTELLWVYEGLTSYLGDLLAARSGLRSPEDARERFAWLAARLSHLPGRKWRPLRDTAAAAQILYGAPEAWESWRRSVDFYDEGVMIWLEADVLIRQKSGGKRSLDDFCRRFLGGGSGPPEVRTYTLDDVVSALDAVASHDWRGFIRQRIEETADRAPLQGIEGGGWSVVYDEEQPQILKSIEEVTDQIDVRFSLGMLIEKDGTVIDVIPGLPADSAGVGPGMKLVAVNGRRYSREKLRTAVRDAGKNGGTVDLLLENGDVFRTFRLGAKQGERYPHLVRLDGKQDVLSEILKPRRAGASR